MTLISGGIIGGLITLNNSSTSIFIYKTALLNAMEGLYLKIVINALAQKLSYEASLSILYSIALKMPVPESTAVSITILINFKI